ncbi:hypothetical protein LZ30DRAFT_610943, partial [Colletotrichum cereale]
LRSSYWAERGWTYQEGYQSLRLLTFTEYQVSYLCNATHCMEAIKRPLGLSAKGTGTNPSFLNIISSITASSGKSKEGKTAQWEQLKGRQLVNYTERDLKNVSDSLNAALGLFRALQTGGIRHLYGIPVSQPS